MSYQRKLMLTYSLLISLLVAFFGVGFYWYNSRQMVAEVSNEMVSTAEKMVNQLDTLIRPMDFVAVNLLSDADVLAAMSGLKELNRADPKNAEFLNEARETIKAAIYNYSFNKNFRRVTFYNGSGDFFSSYFDATTISAAAAAGMIRDLPWLERADAARGRFVLIPSARDNWATAKEEEADVFRLVRSVQFPSNGVGYVEVQNPSFMLEEILLSPVEEERHIIVLNPDGSLFYSDLANTDAAADMDVELQAFLKVLSVLQVAPSGVETVKNGPNQETVLVTSAVSDFTGLQVLLIQNQSVVMQPLIQAGEFIVAVALIILIVSNAFIYLTARQLSKPIRELRDLMEDTKLVNLNESFETSHHNNEIEALNVSFRDLRLRLNDALNREIRANNLQMEASLDSLQAHVNPHFIYNILNVLSNKSITTGDEEIGEICNGIASMLRYSTATATRETTVEEELKHVSNYLLLMKKRFEHKLEYRIQVDEALLLQPMPKIILQQIVENALNHGYDNTQKIMQISIRGYEKEDWWYIEVVDNGQGFTVEALQKLKENMKNMHDSLLDDKRHQGFRIGGMGLVNTYARLMLFYHDELCFRLENSPDGGAVVTIGSRIRHESAV